MDSAAGTANPAPHRDGRARRRLDPERLARLLRRIVLPLALLGAIAFFATFGAMRVPSGMDSLPDIPPGSLCLVDRRGSQAVVGDEVFVDVPTGGTLLTRVTALDGDLLVLQNDNPRSPLPDSDQFGPLARSAVRGVVITVFAAGDVPIGAGVPGPAEGQRGR